MKIDEDKINQTLALMKMENAENEFQRIPLIAESKIRETIRLGKWKDLHISAFDKLKDNLGRMSENGMTNMTYLSVAAITLWSRDALDGGADPDDVFDLSDALLNVLSSCTEAEEIYDLYRTAAVMLAKLVSCKKKQPSFQIERVQNYIGRNIFSKITLKDLSEYTNLSVNYLCSLFTSNLGISIHQYIQREKIQVACNLLQHTDRSISDIAAYMGFQTQSNFAAIFKKWQGISPTEYRKKNYKEVY